MSSDLLSNSSWSATLKATFRVTDVAAVADSVESLIYEENSSRIFRLDTLWIEDDPLDRGDAFCANDDNLLDAQDPENALWVAFMMFLPSWAGLTGECEVDSERDRKDSNLVRVSVSCDEISITDLQKLRDWLGSDPDPDNWFEPHFNRFVAEISGAELVKFTFESATANGQ